MQKITANPIETFVNQAFLGLFCIIKTSVDCMLLAVRKRCDVTGLPKYFQEFSKNEWPWCKISWCQACRCRPTVNSNEKS